jgi:wyosine [tRNA(Phe)-imidazoG37] synthetase (radical SAM superfamily)
MTYRYLFGPVQSRRLGISLGVDCIPPKTCNLDCVYCECGQTTHLSMTRKEYIPAKEIIDELKTYLAGKPTLDFITFGGSGEPTLNSKIGDIARFLKNEFPQYKRALLTNGTLFYIPEVREAAMAFDCVLPSLDAISLNVFRAVNRPAPALSLDAVIEGLVAFSKEYTGTMWVEVFIIPGTNDSPEELAHFKETLLRLSPGRVQLNSLDRPGTVKNIPVPSRERLAEIAKFLLPLPVEIISRAPLGAAATIDNAGEEALLSALRRRPLTIEEMAVFSGTTINGSSEMAHRLQKEGKISLRIACGRTFYCATADTDTERCSTQTSRHLPSQ